MTKSLQEQARFRELELRLKTILPEEYQDHYEDVQPVSMGSASLKLGPDGKVAWDEIWESYCDLAMAGGPPHKGMLLEPGSSAEVDAQPGRYREIVEEICRGISLTTDLAAVAAPDPGWVQVECPNRVTSEWLVRAIVTENISARVSGTALYLPAAPSYRVEKEVKNVITAISKTCHYWFDHMLEREQKIIEKLLLKMEAESPLIQPALSQSATRSDAEQTLRTRISDSIVAATGLPTSSHNYAGWLGVDCPNVRSAIWMMRAIVASNVLSRRENTTLFLPINPATDPDGAKIVQTLATVHAFAVSRRVNLADAQ